ncbi:hypothetical protein V3429_15960 [Aeromonas jandaei]|uniref:hypothetical protein n=1 Tax=Aeromonas TaxID=642 RepID=UPI001C2143A0|nr:hypothetical protein [Aeromonas sp. FDAARGOS 1410]QXC38035.1 hypothetical protein I6L40_19485 [Aeromonas sp. FDAARGOS 1410]
MRNTLLAFCLSLLSIVEPALAETKPTFTPDANVQKVAEAYAQDAVDMAKNQFGITLDWSDASIPTVEKALALMHSSFITTKPRPTEEQAMSFAKGYGSYIGEVYRRNHGGEWGIVSLNGQKFPGLKTKSGVNFWPWGRALNRIMQGPENNVADYYRALLEK